MRDYYNVKINLPGGIASPGFLKEILLAAREANVHKVRFGSRQQMLITAHYEDMRFLEKSLKKAAIRYEVNTDRNPNIVSSYCGEDVFRTGQWLLANEYHSVLDCFDYQPSLKVNISDSNQSFTPFFTGNLNFISSPEPHFWYLYVRPRQSNVVFKWRELIYTNEIGKLANAVEACLLEDEFVDEETLFSSVNARIQYISQPAVGEIELPSFSLPYYEGFNRYESRTWLGLYRRDELFSVDFLLDVCALCMKTKIGEICITPWKSLIIKGIEDQYRGDWSSILGKHNINVRHAANELAWQTEDHHEEGSVLKKELIQYFDKHDTRTFGLCFGIQTRPKSEVFGSVLIKKRPLIRIGQLAILSLYDIYYTENFNPNSRRLLAFEKGLYRMQLAVQLEKLCRRFNNQRSKQGMQLAFAAEEESQQQPEPGKVLHQCPDCFTVYDPQYGDEQQCIPPDTPFEALPESYCCAVCGIGKAELREVVLEVV
ncbi:rubredoxin domain-containing protein [Dyadobacter crusticola]|uniref:rubredoxin domain-containing protein n=1 Tax=Dyadobacter crusticola TaxID=292407 RepID=UPI0004E26C17|nr:rubredoxin domain-containing protein [Dyadobacter crusticola]